MKETKENQLQMSIVVWFSQNKPEMKGQLFSVRNTTFSQKDGLTQKAMGMVAGVSDLILVLENKTIAIEIKHPEKKHNRDHVQRQAQWGQKMIHMGWNYYVVTSLKEFKMLVNHGIAPYWTLDKIRKRMSLSGATITFNQI